MAVGDTITATRYNQLQATVNAILGTGSRNTGYGIQNTSLQIRRGNTVTAADINKLRADLLAIYVHQNGSTAGFPSTLEKQITETINEFDYTILTDTISNLLTNKNQYTPSFTQISQVRTTSVRRASWGGFAQAQSVFHEVRVDFASPDQRRHFFNTGSVIQFEASLSTVLSSGKNADWSNMFDELKEISFKSNQTTTTGIGIVGTGDPNLPLIGNFNLTANYQTIYTISGFDFPANTYIIKAKSINAESISFLIEFNDFDTGTTPNADQPVEGTLTSTVSQIRATGNNIPGVTNVVAPLPRYSNLKQVNFSPAPTPTFLITPSVISVNEGSSVTFNVTTSFIANGTTLYWTTQPVNGIVNADDFTDNQVSGSFTINNNSGSIVRGIRADNLTEGIESFRLQLRTGSTNGIIQSTSSTVTINDTSTNPPPSPPPGPPPPPPPPPPPTISCNSGQSARRRTGWRWKGRFTNTYTLQFGTGTGRAGINFDAGSWVRDSFRITWNGQTVSTGNVRRRGSLTFNKTSAFPTTATLTVRSPRFSFFSWRIRCPS